MNVVIAGSGAEPEPVAPPAEEEAEAPNVRNVNKVGHNISLAMDAPMGLLMPNIKGVQQLFTKTQECMVFKHKVSSLRGDEGVVPLNYGVEHREKREINFG